MEDTKKDVFKEGGIDIRKIAAETRKLEKRIKYMRKKLEKEKKQRETLLEEIDSDELILFKINELYNKLGDETDPEKLKILAQDIKKLERLIKDSDATDSEEDIFYDSGENKRDDDSGEDSEATDDDPIGLDSESESDENPLQYIKLKL